MGQEMYEKNKNWRVIGMEKIGEREREREREKKKYKKTGIKRERRKECE